MKGKIGLVLILIASVFFSCRAQKNVYLFTGFHEPANAGLRLLYSHDGYHWTDFNHIFITPQVGSDKIMRDPSIQQGPDGVYHLVWTIAWKASRSIGYAESKDLIHWSPERTIEVMADEPTAVNAWAPELFYDDKGKQFIIIWASCVPYRFAKGEEDEKNNHRLYYTITKDFKTFTPAKLYLDPGFSVIDAELVKLAKGSYELVMKDNTRPCRNILVAHSTNPLGPFTDYSKRFTEMYSEGPTMTKAGNNWLIYYDSYRLKKFGCVRTSDFKTFTNITDSVSVPQGHKHGTIFKVTEKTLKKLQAATTSN